uniref:polysaccharide pyruvyl transferase family protein n=1 Tax=Variovorax sp. BK018 TaxID=3450241 RepID=UPI0040399462
MQDTRVGQDKHTEGAKLRRAAAAGPRPRVGVLTFHRCINYGSYWQARSLVEGLQRMGCDTVLLDHRSRRVDIAEWRCALKPVLPTPVPGSDRRLYAAKTRCFFEAFEQLPRSGGFAMERPPPPELLGKLDTAVVGSDEVWNFSHPWYARVPLFFGERVPARRVVAYAASFGHHPAARGVPRPWGDALLRNFHALSVRDENSRALVAGCLGRSPARVLDPCLQFDSSSGDGDGVGRATVTPMRCIALYGHNFSEAFAARLRAAALRHRMLIVSVGYRNDWADVQWLTAGPEDFARLMASAGAVATNFFHGCVFALRHGRPLLCEPSSYRSIKIDDLLGTLAAQCHLANPQAGKAAWDTALTEPPAPVVQLRIAAMRQASANYLRDAIGLHALPEVRV